MQATTENEIKKMVTQILDKPLFVLKIVYKSGHVEMMPFHKFTYDNGVYEWETPCSTISEKMELSQSIIHLNPSEIESIFQYDSFEKTSDFITKAELLNDLVRINDNRRKSNQK